MTDARRRHSVKDPLEPYRRNDPCWCGSGEKYKRCHAIQELTAPGAALPDDPEDGLYIHPRVVVDTDAFSGHSGPVPITIQHPHPQAVPVTVEATVAALADVGFAGPPPSLKDLGQLRYAILETSGVIEPDRVRAGEIDDRIAAVIGDLAPGALQLARCTIDALLAAKDLATQPVVIRSDATDPARLVGSTMLWADHYIVDDLLARTALTGTDDPKRWRQALATLLELRPLIETGLVVPALSDLPLAVLAPASDALTHAELSSGAYVTWAKEQLVIEGPTAREAVFVHVLDDYPHADWFWLHGRVGKTVPQSDTGTLVVSNELFRPYDPDYDYEPWIETVKRQAVARLTQEMSSDLVVTGALGAEHVTTSPFRARAMRRRLIGTADSATKRAAGLVWADVPYLAEASPHTLASMATSEERVADLRRSVAAAMRALRADDLAVAGSTATDLAHELTSRGEELGRNLRRRAARDAIAPGMLAAGSVVLTATLAPQMALALLMAGGASVIPAVRAMLADRRTAPYAFWMAQRRT